MNRLILFFENLLKKGTVLTRKTQPAVKAKAIMESSKPQLPYDYFSLTWDSSHLSNEENTYCYCGGPGEWCVKMLQCHQCKQWFHEKCIRCLDKTPLYFGDRFFIFICSVCCEGPEILRRLELSWLDVIHLVIYNMTVIENKTYFDINLSILPTVAKSLNFLQLSREFAATSIVEREKIVLNVLRTNHRLFKCGREIRKRSTLWGLRSRAPPVVPDIHVNVEKLFAEKLTLQMNKKLDICRISTLRRSGRCDDVVIDASIPKFVLSEPKGYQTLLPTPPPEDLMPDCTFKKIRRSLKSVLNGRQKRPRSSSTVSSNPKVKKPTRSEPRDAPKIVARKGTIQHGKPDRSGSTGSRGSTSTTTATTTTAKHPRPSSPVLDENTLLGTLETLIPPPPSFAGINNPFYLPTDRLRPTKRSKQHSSTANDRGVTSASTSTSASNSSFNSTSNSTSKSASNSTTNSTSKSPSKSNSTSISNSTTNSTYKSPSKSNSTSTSKSNSTSTSNSTSSPTKRHCTRSSTGGCVIKSEPKTEKDSATAVTATNGRIVAKVNGHHPPKRNGEVAGHDKLEVAEPRSLRSARHGGSRKCVEDKRSSSADHQTPILRLNGSRCRAMASRRSPGGKVQYLIEWNEIAD